MNLGKTTSRLGVLLLVVWTSSAYADYGIQCGSDGGRYKACQLREPGIVRIARQISGAKCEQGRSWDFNRREIWVDHGCEAQFVVEGPPGGYGQPREDDRYRDPHYYGARHSSYVPDWLIGSFRGYNEQYRSDVSLTVRPDGRATARWRDEAADGFVNDGQLHIGNLTFDIDQTRDGLTTSQRGNRDNVVRYRRVE